jgi:hypothetical protein
VAANIKEIIMASNKSVSHKIGRDARTGEFIPVKEAQRRPSTTVVETIKNPTPRSSGNKKK